MATVEWGEDAGGPGSAALGFLGGVLWAAYPTGLSVIFRGSAPGQPPYTPETVVYAQLLAVPPVLVLVGVPAVRRLPGAGTAWGRRGIGLVAAGATLVAVGVLAVTLLEVPGQAPTPLAVVAPVGLFLLQFGGTALGYALRTRGDDPSREEDAGSTFGEFHKQRRVAGGLLVLSVPATLLGIAGTSLLYSAVPFCAGVAVPVGLGWAGACYAVLVGTYGEDDAERALRG